MTGPRRSISLLVLLALGVLTAASGRVVAREHEAGHFVLQVELDEEPITPITARFVRGAIELAEDERAQCVVLVLDTPGGLVDSTRVLVKTMLRADIPVVVFVPPGGRAASAGLFLTLASHVAAMAPGSNIGAAHPVQVGGLPIGPGEAPEGERPEAEGDTAARSLIEDKVVNDTTAWARSLAELRGRNAEWAERAVRESASVSSDEALSLGVIDIVARGVDDLLARLDGREVMLPQRTVTLDTAAVRIRTVEMWWGDRVLAVLSNPNLAFLLLIFGFYGILFELYSPGWGVGGTLGVILLVLGFFALSVLPINYVGLILVAVALGMFVAEAFVTSYGALAVGGVVCLTLGGLMLVESPAGFLRVSLGVVLPVAGATAFVTVFLVSRIVTAHRGKVMTGEEGMVGERVVAEDEFSSGPEGYTGTVRTHGEIWRAASAEPVAAGQMLEVESRKGLTLVVKAVHE